MWLRTTNHIQRMIQYCTVTVTAVTCQAAFQGLRDLEPLASCRTAAAPGGSSALRK